ncbi:MAG: hypothetical protein MUC33_21255 [Desulfobacterales bacterium]|jgi:hypothetical protein|nr:hypothetical protein [Desulfobacterales bacterium]
MLDRIVPSVFALDPGRLDLLKGAIFDHTAGLISTDPTVGACWDADRLDIGRVGFVPDPAYFSTAAGKAMAGLQLLGKEMPGRISETPLASPRKRRHDPGEF